MSCSIHAQLPYRDTCAAGARLHAVNIYVHDKIMETFHMKREKKDSSSTVHPHDHTQRRKVKKESAIKLVDCYEGESNPCQSLGRRLSYRWTIEAA